MAVDEFGRAVRGMNKLKPAGGNTGRSSTSGAWPLRSRTETAMDAKLLGTNAGKPSASASVPAAEFEAATTRPPSRRSLR
jgi:hypothetical protein